MNKHSPGPWEWHVVPDGAVVKRIFTDDLGRRCHEFLALCSSATAPNETNAQFIVRAVNSHESLLEACKVAAGFLEASGGIPGDDDVFATLMKAIKAAEGEESTCG